MHNQFQLRLHRRFVYLKKGNILKLKALFKSVLQEIKNTFWNPILLGSSFLIFVVLITVILSPEFFFNILSWIQNIFVLNVSWFYVSLLFFFFCFCLYLAFGPYGKVRLGLISKPKYSNFTWIAMLFSAGMGTGLLFSGVYEPLYHYFYPPSGKGGTMDSLDLSFQLTFLHWGFSGWAVYTLMGLSIAYFSFRKNFPMRISYMFRPLLKKNTKKMIFIDILSVTVILFGVATTLGRGALQINAGLKELFDFPYSQSVQSVIILVITLIATLSLLSGLNRGIRRLSELNIFICVLLLLFVLCAGPTVFLLNSFVEHSGAYLQNLFSSMTWVNSLGSTEWRSQWTILYWAWWISWAPFVGLFIARISEGRTIRQLVIGCLLVPTLLSCLWFVVFGGTAIQAHIAGTMDLKPILKTEYSNVVFEFLKHLPFTKIASILILFSITIFFVTSSDSASYVVHSISSSDSNWKSSLNKKGSLFNKIYWAVLEGVLAMTMIYLGGIKSLELLVIIMAFPFSILLCLICYSFFKELRKDFLLEQQNDEK